MFFFFKQKTAYEMRISDWSSDVCSSDLQALGPFYQQRPFGKRLVQSQFFRLFGMREAVEIDMPDRQSHFGRGIALDKGEAGAGRSEERREGKECVSTCSSRRSPYH